MLSDGSNIFPLDHELSFSFVFDVIQNNKPWEFNAKDREWIGKNILWQPLKGKSFDFEQLSLNLDRLNSIFWDKALMQIPSEWHGSQFERIRKTLELIIQNKSRFIHELKTILA